MKHRIAREISIIFLALGIAALLSACAAMGEERYLSNRENYEIVQGTVTYIFYSDEEKRFYVALEGLPERYYNGFTLLGDNFSIAKENGLYEKVQIGTAVVLETAPKYFTTDINIRS